MKPQYQYFVVTIEVNWLIDRKGCRFETGRTIDIDPFSLCRFPSPNLGTEAAAVHTVPKVEWIAHGVAHRHPIKRTGVTGSRFWQPDTTRAAVVWTSLLYLVQETSRYPAHQCEKNKKINDRFNVWNHWQSQFQPPMQCNAMHNVNATRCRWTIAPASLVLMSITSRWQSRRCEH